MVSSVFAQAETTAEEKTEKATAKRRNEARKKGQVAQSKELSSVLILMRNITFLYFRKRKHVRE